MGGPSGGVPGGDPRGVPGGNRPGGIPWGIQEGILVGGPWWFPGEDLWELAGGDHCPHGVGCIEQMSNLFGHEEMRSEGNILASPLLLVPEDIRHEFDRFP